MGKCGFGGKGKGGMRPEHTGVSLLVPAVARNPRVSLHIVVHSSHLLHLSVLTSLLVNTLILDINMVRGPKAGQLANCEFMYDLY
jgi:hypothetical protein